jgi:transposase
MKEMIRYKAEMAGIWFELVNPKHTSQPANAGIGRKPIEMVFSSSAKLVGADLNGAINIAKAIPGLSA